MQNYKVKYHFWPCSKTFDQVQKILNKFKKFWTWSKYFWTSRWNRHKFTTLWTVYDVKEKDLLEWSWGAIHLERPLKSNKFQVKCPHRSCRDHLGSSKGVFSCDIIDSPLYTSISTYRLIIMRLSSTFFISAITWHDIQQLSIDLPEFTQFVQLVNWQNNSCKFV
jgi:hypothetical protein